MSNKKNIHGDVGNCLWHWVYNIKETTKHAIVVICKSKIIKSGQPLWNPFNWWSWENYGETHDETKWNILLEPWDLTLFWLVVKKHLEKWWSSSMGRMIPNILWKIKFMFQTTNQIYDLFWDTINGHRFANILRCMTWMIIRPVRPSTTTTLTVSCLGELIIWQHFHHINMLMFRDLYIHNPILRPLYLYLLYIYIYIDPSEIGCVPQWSSSYLHQLCDSGGSTGTS
jgi:hypothetical protein